MKKSLCKERKNISGIQFEDDTLYITYSVMETFFHESMAGICACTIKAIQSLPANIDTIYLVGGFGGCKYVCGKMENALSNQLPQQQFQAYCATSTSASHSNWSYYLAKKSHNH